MFEGSQIAASQIKSHHHAQQAPKHPYKTHAHAHARGGLVRRPALPVRSDEDGGVWEEGAISSAHPALRGHLPAHRPPRKRMRGCCKVPGTVVNAAACDWGRAVASDYVNVPGCPVKQHSAVALMVCCLGKGTVPCAWSVINVCGHARLSGA